MPSYKQIYLSYDVAVIQCITSCHKTYDNTCNNTLARRHNVTDHVRVNDAFLIDIMINPKAITFHFKRAYDQKNLTLAVVSYEIYETRRRLISQIGYEMTTRVRSSL